MSRYSSDIDDQRATEIVGLGELAVDRFREFSSSDFEAVESEDVTVSGNLVPPAPAYRIVIGRPVTEDEFGALKEVVDVLGAASDEKARPRAFKWVGRFFIGVLLAAAPYDPVEPIAVLIRFFLR